MKVAGSLRQFHAVDIVLMSGTAASQCAPPKLLGRRCQEGQHLQPDVPLRAAMVCSAMTHVLHGPPSTPSPYM